MSNRAHVSPALLAAHNIESFDALDDLEALALIEDRAFWLREDQYPPHNNWRQLGYICGRSLGKTYACAAIVTDLVDTGQARSIALSAQDLENGYALCVESLLAAAPVYNEARLYRDRVEWRNGARAFVFTPESPDAPRGFNLDCAWLTEVAAYSDRDGVLLYDNIMSAMRDAGGAEHILWDTTPRGSSALLRMLIRLNEQDPVAFPIIRGTTYQNPWLSKAFLRHQAMQYGPETRKYKEEILAQVFDGSDGALWTRSWIDDFRVRTAPPLTRVIIGYDPAGSDRAGSDDSGIVVAGADDRKHYYVLHDATAKHSIQSVGHALIDQYLRHRAHGVISERNRGLAFVLENIRAAASNRGLRVNEVKGDAPFPSLHDPHTINVREVTSRGQKLDRAAPVVALYSQGRVHHVGDFSTLENEQVTYDGTGDSPNAFDACNMALTELANLRTGKTAPTSADRQRNADILRRVNAQLGRATDASRSREVGLGGSRIETPTERWHRQQRTSFTVPRRDKPVGM